MSSIEEEYIRIYEEQQATLCAPCAPVLNSCRKEAFEQFRTLGFPTPQQEQWRNTNVPALFDYNYGLNLRRLAIPVNPYEVFRCDVPQINPRLYFVVNDSFYTGGKTPEAGDDGLLIGSLNRMAAEHPDLVSRYYNHIAGEKGDGLTAFNTTFTQDGLFIYIPRGITVEKPIQIVNVMRSQVDLMSNRRLLIILEEGASARILLCDHTMDNVKFLSTQVTEAFVGERASLDLYELEESNNSNVRLSTLYVAQQAGSRTLLNGTTLMGGTTRNTTRVYLQGVHAETRLTGLAIGDKRQHIDNNTYIEHATTDGVSNELYKYVLDDSATAVFSGLVLVRPGAQHTSSQQTNRNLCLTREARMWARPQLEIYADDVKCSHGATVGQLDDNALFYMQQRGIPLPEARLLLMFAFAEEVIDTIAVEALRSRLHLLVEKRFRGELDKCVGCTLCK